ncbi:hypothetical protein BKH46_01285 [Helicobacter sp. 12S02634-8]|nr:hypothetical protein BKH46_01285 [Helicobacter sp. 12S02634-8]
MFCVENAGYHRGEKNILDGISLGLERGEILAVLGCNGVGKTTFLKCCMGLLRWRAGRSLLLGQDIALIRDFWKKVSYVPQAKSMHIGIKVLDMVVLGCNPFLKLAPKKEHFKLALEACERLGIERLADSYCHLLSGGELQMVLFARALVSKPLLLVLDEPESHLDIKNQLLILNLLKNLSLEGTGIIFNTHYPNHAFKIASKCLLLYRENHTPQYVFGVMQEVLCQSNLSQIFDVPLEMFVHTSLDF